MIPYDVYGGPKEGDPIEHVERSPIPWRDAGQLTECGLPTAGHPTIPRDAFVAKVTSQGRQRASMSTCMTCWGTATRHKTWDEDPVSAMAREVQFSYRNSTIIRTELKALAILVNRHREEFREIIQDHAETVPIGTAKKKTRSPRREPRKW